MQNNNIDEDDDENYTTRHAESGKKRSYRLETYWPEGVEKKLGALRKGDHVTVRWIDASQSSNVELLNEGELKNHSVESVCENMGVFYSLQKGSAYNDVYIVIKTNDVDKLRGTIVSIPLCLVKKIEGPFRNVEMALVKMALIKQHRGRTAILRFRDGSIKRIGSH